MAQIPATRDPSVDQQLAALKESVFRQKYEDWLDKARSDPPNSLIARYIAAPGPLSEKILRQYFQDSIFEPWLKEQTSGGPP